LCDYDYETISRHREINLFGYKEGHLAMNRDEGSGQLSDAHDRLLDATAIRPIKILHMTTATAYDYNITAKCL